MGELTHNFDSVFEISLEKFQTVIQREIVDNIPEAFSDLSFLVTPETLFKQTGRLVLSDPSSALIALNAGSTTNNAFKLTLTFANGFLSLNAIEVDLGLSTDILDELVSKPIGEFTIEVPLQISTVTNDARTKSPIRIELDPEESIIISDFSEISPAAMGLDFPANSSRPIRLGQIQTAAAEAMINRIISLLFPHVINIDLPGSQTCNFRLKDLQLKLLPGDSNIDTTDSLAFFSTLKSTVNGESSGFTKSSLKTGKQGGLLIDNEFLLDLICCVLRQSTIIQGINSDPERDTNKRTWKNMKNIVFEGSTFSEAKSIVIEFEEQNDGSKLLVLSVSLHQDDVGFCSSADINFKVKLGFGIAGNGTLIPIPVLNDEDDDGINDVDVQIHTDGWCIFGYALLVGLIAAVTGGLIGVVLGIATALTVVFATIVGFGIGFLAGVGIYYIVVLLLSKIVDTVTGLADDVLGELLGPLENSLQLLELFPRDLIETFGSLVSLTDVMIDDLILNGKVGFKNIGPPVAESEDQILKPGEMINLDNGRVYSTGTARLEGDADLVWKERELVNQVVMYMAGGANVNVAVMQPLELKDYGTSRLVVLEDEPFLSLSLSDISKINYSNNSHTTIAEADVPNPGPLCGLVFTPDNFEEFMIAPDPKGSSQKKTKEGKIHKARSSREIRGVSGCGPFVFAVRTTEGRYARCQAWRDNLHNLHLRYTTFSTRLVIEFLSSMRKTLGASGSVHVDNMGIGRTPVSWKGNIRAKITDLIEPYQTLQWQWQGVPLGTGTGTLAGTHTLYKIVRNVISLETEMGETVQGDLGFTVRDGAGVEVFKNYALNLGGTQNMVVNTLEVGTPPSTPNPMPPFTHFDTGMTVRKQLRKEFAKKLKVSEKEINI